MAQRGGEYTMVAPVLDSIDGGGFEAGLDSPEVALLISPETWGL